MAGKRRKYYRTTGAGDAELDKTKVKMRERVNEVLEGDGGSLPEEDPQESREA